MSSSDNLTDNEVAFAAINLFANKPTGPEPDWQEIHDWHMELIEEPRAEQILAHVANNPECFQKWRDICEAAEFLEQNPLDEPEAQHAEQSTHANPAPWDLVGWLQKGAKALLGQPLPAIGGAVAATVLAVVIVPKLLNAPTANPGDLINSSLAQYSALGAPLPQTALSARTTRSLAGVLGNLSDEDVEKHQLNFGFKQAFDAINTDNRALENNDELLQWMPWLESLPDAAVDCTLASDQQHCENIDADIQILGQWALVNQLACTTAAEVPDDFTVSQTDTIAVLKNIESLKTSELVTPLIEGQIKEPAEVCSLAQSLISIASE